MAAGYARSAIDLGTGDGRFVLRRAADDPDLLIVGVDANAASMFEASRRATRKRPLPNALFVMAAAESLPPELYGFADEVTIHFPWGSLLRGLLRADPAIVEGLLAVTRPGAVVTMLLSVTGRDRVDGVEALDGSAIDELRARMARVGLRTTEARPASREDVDAANSSWSKRLAAGARRDAWLLRLEVQGNNRDLRNSIER